MKKLFILSLAALGFVACSKRADYIILSGKLDGVDGKEGITLKLIGGEVQKDIKVKTDGTFCDTLHIPTNYYTIAGLNTNMYLEQGDELTINVNLAQMPPVVKFSGKDSIANVYLQKKRDLLMESQKTLEPLFGKSFEELSKGIDDLQSKYTTLLKETKKLSKDFVSKEEKAIKYETLYMKTIYPNYHFELTKEDVQLPKSFTDELGKLDYDIAEDFENFNAYKMLVLNNFYRELEKSDDKENIWGKPVAYVKGLKSENIKKKLATDFIEYVSPTNTPESNEQLVSVIKAYVKDTMALKELDRRMVAIEKLKPGKDFAGFECEDVNGKMVNYETLKGKLVYIDVWATWCKPCVGEIPAMKALQEAYKGKNIVFVGISVDRDKEAWKKMVAEEKLGGLQLYVPMNVINNFSANYELSNIPRFMLVSKEGKIIDINAPRPSEDKIKALIDANL